jgi:hypothetical protein
MFAPMTPAKRQDSLLRRSKRPWLCPTNVGVPRSAAFSTLMRNANGKSPALERRWQMVVSMDDIGRQIADLKERLAALDRERSQIAADLNSLERVRTALNT